MDGRDGEIVGIERRLIFGLSDHPKPGRLAHVLANAEKQDASFDPCVGSWRVSFFASRHRI
jgi:hypothetical protein